MLKAADLSPFRDLGRLNENPEILDRLQLNVSVSGSYGDLNGL
jgi:hypothetical protein